MKKIRTITLNPVFDLHYDVPDFSPGRENLVSAVERYAGGKGVNTARALAANGAGDSAIAGLLAAAARGAAKEDRLRLAMAYGTAACMTRGTLPPRPADVETLLPQIKIERV